MTARLEFFYDYVSVYSYLANSQLDRFENVVYRPMLLGAVMEATGNRPPATIKAKGVYLFSDVERWARRYGLPYKMNSVFPQMTVNALRLAIVAERRDVFPDLHQRLFNAMWAEDRNISDKEVLASIVTEAGLPADEFMAEIGEQSVKDALKSNTEEAVQRGVFGGPTFFVGDEMFFGNDRFEFVEEALARA